MIANNPIITTTEIAERIGVTRRSIAKTLNCLKEDGLVRRIGSDKGGHWEIIDSEN